MKHIFFEWIQIAAGLLVFAFGVHLTIFANIGLAPWDCLGMGISLHTPLNYGLSMTVMGIVILGIDLLLKERIGFGTIIDALLTGNFVQMFNDLNPFPENQNTAAGIVFMLAGFVFMALGMWIYMQAGQCCGPRDALLVGLGRRMPHIPIGIGTLISTFGAGAVMQLVYSLLRFEPRSIQHRSVFEITRLLSASSRGQRIHRRS